MKKVLINIFDKFGYQVKFKLNKKKEYKLAKAEVDSLEKDLNAFIQKFPDSRVQQNDQSINWSDPKVLRSYLDNSRITLFHELVKITQQNGIDFNQKEILDVGSGTGYLLRLVNQKFEPKKLVGYDSYTELNKLAAVLCPEMTIFEKDLFSEYESAYDIIFCTETLEHVNRPDKAIDNMRKNIRKNGFIILTVPDGRKDTYGSHGLYPNEQGYWGHINFWSIESWTIFLKTAFEGQEVITGHVGEFDVIYGIIKM